VESAPLAGHTNACVDPLGGSVLDGAPVQVPPVAPGVLVTWTFGANEAAVGVHAPSAASQTTGLLQLELPIEMSMDPTLHDGEEVSAQSHPQTAGPPVGAVDTAELGPEPGGQVTSLVKSTAARLHPSGTGGAQA
jgi:hypothetical protein